MKITAISPQPQMSINHRPQPDFSQELEKATILAVVRDYLKTLSSGQEFSSLDLVGYVRRQLNRPYLMDGSILRKLRECRLEFGIECVDHRRSIYKMANREPVQIEMWRKK